MLQKDGSLSLCNLQGNLKSQAKSKKTLATVAAILCHEGLEPNFPGCEVNDKQEEIETVQRCWHGENVPTPAIVDTCDWVRLSWVETLMDNVVT